MINKRLLTFSITIIVSLIFVINASALSGGTWQSGIKVQNLDPSNQANITIGLYNASGSLQHTINTTSGGSPLVAQPNASVEVYLPNYSSVNSGQYSAVVSSDRSIGSVVTTTNYPYGIADSYNSMQPNTNVFVPYVYHNHNNYSTEIFIQNTTSSTVTGNVIFTEPPTSVSYGDSGVHTKTVPINIPANGAVSLDTSTSSYNDLGWFIGSATIQASGNVAVVANQTRLVGAGDVQGNVLISTRGLSTADAGTKVLLPSLYKNFSGASGTWRSGITIVNPSGSNANVTVEFKSDPDAPVSLTGTKSLNISAGASTELFLPSVTLDGGASIPDMFKGYAVITSSVGVVAIVQHTNYAGGGGYGVAVGYAGFSSGSSKISLPSLYHWPSGAGVWVSGIKVQNYGSSPATFTITYSPDPDSVSSVSGSKTNVSLNPNQAIEFYFGNPVLDSNGVIPSGWKGSALIQGGSGAELVATVIHTNYGRHVANMYTGIPVP